MKILYLTWDGPDQPYLETLFFPIFELLKRKNLEVHVVQFTWGDPAFAERQAAAALKRGIRYRAVRVPQTPKQATVPFAIALGSAVIIEEMLRHSFDVVMPRSHIPAAMVLGARAVLRGRTVVWDSDGLMPDERVDFAGWNPKGANYRAFRTVEKWMLSLAKVTLTRSAQAAAILQERAGRTIVTEVVPNGKDDAQFTPGTEESRALTRSQLGLTSAQPLVVYVGSMGPQYHPQLMATYFAAILKKYPQAHFLALTGAGQTLQSALEASHVPSNTFTIQKAAAGDVPQFLAAADVAFALREPSLSQRAVCPIKVAEYLLCGVPVIANTGVGDLDTQLADGEVGLVLAALNAEKCELVVSFVERVLAGRDHVREIARRTGQRHFTVQECAEGYARALLRS